MAQGYALRYYKSYDLNGHKVKLDIYKKYPAVEYAPAPMEIGRVLQGLSLDVQGEQDDIISPIVKTSLSMTFADAPGEEKGKKTGDWEEFYTPDSTGYKVLLYIDGALYWSGYVTPDSFEEDLEYRGSVTIVARDNIGHLQDFDFDAEGNSETMISVRSLINSAWNKVSCLLSLTYASGSDVVWPTCEGYSALDCLLNVEAFAEKNWFEALEAVLDSFGLVLRFVGNNKAMIMPLRTIPCLDKGQLSLVEVKKVLFQATAHRSLMQAMKKIKDVGKYDIEKVVAMNSVKEEDFINTPSTYKCLIEGENFGILEHDAPVWPLRQKQSGWQNSDIAQTLFFNVWQYDLGYFLKRSEDEISVKGNDVMYIAANNTDDRNIIFSQRVLSKSLSISMHFGQPLGITNAGALEDYNNLRLSKIVYQLLASDGADLKYWDGNSWTLTNTDITTTYDVNSNINHFDVLVNLSDISTESTIVTLCIKKIEYLSVGPIGVPDIGVYARLLKLTFNVPADVPIMEELVVNSIYDESHNYSINREADFVAPEQTFAIPKIIKNGIYLPTSGNRSATHWQWPGGAKTSLQALIAQQILMYYSQPNSVITGTLLAIAEKGEVLDFNCLWSWRNKKLALISGQLDLMTGFIEGAKLREYLDWEKLWPAEGLLITEAEKYVITENESTIKIGK